MKVIVRMGPWCHGEVRNGGLPDWVQNADCKLRTNDPAFMQMVKPFYKEIAKQIDGLLWKDGGPVIGIQLDNERNDVKYLLALKDLAKQYGIDVPLYTMTGWNRVAIPDSELLPLFGAYSVAFWYPHSNQSFKKSFFFTDIRDDGDMGAQFVNKRPYRVDTILKYPYVCCEIGGGMPSSYTKRINVEPDEIASMALVRLGCGNNIPGYYMYHGGINPNGNTNLNEEYPNAMPIKDYDFQAPLGAFGQVREHYHLLRLQHLFVEDFGDKLARMQLFLPDKKPKDIDDIDTLRWSVRSDGNSGFIFFNNYQPATCLPAKRSIRFEIKTSDKTFTIPSATVTIPSGSYGIFPFMLNCDGVLLKYAMAQPICRIEENRTTTYFFTAIDGIEPELVFEHDSIKINNFNNTKDELGNFVRIYNIMPGTDKAVSIAQQDKSKVEFVILTPEQSKQLWRMPLAGKQRVILSSANLLQHIYTLRMQSYNIKSNGISFYPAIEDIMTDLDKASKSTDGIFTKFSITSNNTPANIEIKAVKKQQAGQSAYELKGTTEETWQQAAIWEIQMPLEATDKHVLMKINYTGDAARLYVGDKLFDDNYFNGDPFEIGLWRIPKDKQNDVQLYILPYSEGLDSRLPQYAKNKIEQAKKAGTINDISIEAVPTYEIQIMP